MKAGFCAGVVAPNGTGGTEWVCAIMLDPIGLMKSFGEIIQNQLLFEGFGIMKSCGDRN